MFICNEILVKMFPDVIWNIFFVYGEQEFDGRGFLFGLCVELSSFFFGKTFYIVHVKMCCSSLDYKSFDILFKSPTDFFFVFKKWKP